MPGFTDLTGLLGIALATAVLCALGLQRLCRWRYVSTSPRESLFLLPAIAGLVLLGLFLPLGDLPAGAYLRGMVGDLSITTLVLIGYAALRQMVVLPPMSASRSNGAFLVLVLAACMLYPLALGAAPFDSYRWGYGEPWFVGLLLVVALAGLTLRMPLVTISISLAVLAWAAGWYESGNLWDYLIDPMVAGYAVFALLNSIAWLWRLGRSR